MLAKQYTIMISYVLMIYYSCIDDVICDVLTICQYFSLNTRQLYNS